MKKFFIIVFLLSSAGAFAQDHTGFFDQHILGKGKSAPLQFSIDLYPFLFLANGGGGSISLESGHWQAGVVGFSVLPPDFIVETFFHNTENIKVRRNHAVELFANYYLRKDRKGLYTGLLGGPEWFLIEDKLSGAKETIVKNYIVPRMGIRLFPFKRYFYVDASFGWSFNVSGTDSRKLGLSSYNASAGGFIYFLQIGSRFDL